MKKHLRRMVLFDSLVVFVLVLSGTQPSHTVRSAPLLQTETINDPSRVPIYLWTTDFENGLVDFKDDGEIDKTGECYGPTSYYEIVEDPTGSGRGKMYRGVVTGPPPDTCFEGHRHAPFDGLYFPLIDGSYAMEGDIWISEPKPPIWISPPGGELAPWYSAGSLFTEFDNTVAWIAGNHVGVDPRLNDGIYRMAANVHPNFLPKDIDWLGSISPIPFPVRQWVRVREEVDEDGTVRLFQNGVLASAHKLRSDVKIGTTGAHWGLYTGRGVYDFVVLNDNLKFEVYARPGDLRFKQVRSFGETEVPYFDSPNYLNNPVGLGPEGANIWVVECGGHRALKYANNGTFERQLGKAGMPFAAGTGTNLWCLQDVAVDRSGNTWIVGGAQTVTEYDPNGVRLQMLGATWQSGSDNAHFNAPKSIAFDQAGNVYVSDSENHRIQVFNQNGVYRTTIGLTGVPGSTNNRFDKPRHITIDTNNRLYVADSNNHRIQIFNVANVSAITYLATIGVSGVPGSDNAHLDWPQGVAVDVTGGKVYVADANNGRVQVFHYSTRAYQRTLSGFSYIADVAVDSAGNLFVAEPSAPESQVRQFNSNLQYLRTYGTTGLPYGTNARHYNNPSSVAVAPDGSIYIGELEGSRLLKLNVDGVPQWIKGEAGIPGSDNAHFSSIEDVALDPAGQVYVADSGNCRVQIFSANGSYMDTLGTGCGTSNHEFNYPTGVALGPNNTIYVADRDNQRVQVYNNSHAYVATLGETGVPGSSNGQFNSPRDVDVDAAGNIYVADYDNHRVQVFNSNRAYARTIGETGVVKLDHDHLSYPTAVAVAGGRIFVADGATWTATSIRVQVFDSSGTFLTTIRGPGGDRTGQLRGVDGLTVDASGRLYVVEKDFQRVDKFIPISSLRGISIAAQDGGVLESDENSNRGGTMNAGAVTFQLGDDAANRQFRAILSFNTASLPDTAVIQSAVIKIKRNGTLVGVNPFRVLGSLLVDIRKPYFGTAIGLQLMDFSAAASRPRVGTFNATPFNGWYVVVLNAAGRNNINRAGSTQFRLYFSIDDNNDHLANFMQFFSGNAAAANRPALIISYTVP